ncbi:hypothetical protein EHX26_00100 [Brochothrix thermosphacta]|uniref:DUF6941 family protein n=1 Tax=Brochothrix thermosphacta TaxID=2756 RepID=UPI00083F9989|nr:hypothetical protein [Brochothrix thermosphacta]MPQ27517.1 hypothetical protein [Brochothrix thermosphacta]ODJ55789.1 hypothetical protein BFR38_07340 [Brochothrix thermosphacta]
MSNIKVKIILSEAMETQKDGSGVNNLIINPVLVFRSKYIPTAASLAVTVLTSGIAANQSHTMEIRLVRVESDEVLYTTDNNPFAMPDVKDNFYFNLNLNNIAFKATGEYKIVFIIDGSEYEEFFKLEADESLI